MNCQISLIIFVVTAFVCYIAASSVVANDDGNHVQYQTVSAHSQKQHTHLRDLLSNGRSGEERLEERSCTIQETHIVNVPGRCINLLGGRKACVAGQFMDPVAESCNKDE